MNIQLERFGRIFPATAPTVDDAMQMEKSHRKPPSLTVTKSSADAAEIVGLDEEKDLNRNDDIGKMFSAYHYAAPPMPKFEG